ncbi:MAG: hypothetical protein E7335_00865 [Clostridiales bacterium]|nr:hypothetical protein [Clostridiales bacterium]
MILAKGGGRTSVSVEKLGNFAASGWMRMDSAPQKQQENVGLQMPDSQYIDAIMARCQGQISTNRRKTDLPGTEQRDLRVKIRVYHIIWALEGICRIPRFDEDVMGGQSERIGIEMRRGKRSSFSPSVTCGDSSLIRGRQRTALSEAVEP